MSAELSMYKLADLLQMKLSISNGKVEGKLSGTLNTAIGLPIKINVEVLQSFSSEQFGLVCRILGDLCLVASHYPKMGGLSVFLIDASKVTLDGVKCPLDHVIEKNMGLKDVLDSVRGAVVQAYHYKNGWRPLTLPK